MHFAHVIQSRKVRAWAILITLVILVILTAAVFLQSCRSPKPFEMDDLYGLLD
jgi:disulfide bond formation protein DsbB